MGQNVFGLLQILDFEFVLVKLLFTLCKFINVILPLSLKKLDLLFLLLKLLLLVLLLSLGLIHSPFSFPLFSLILFFHSFNLFLLFSIFFEFLLKSILLIDVLNLVVINLLRVFFFKNLQSLFIVVTKIFGGLLTFIKFFLNFVQIDFELFQ